MEQDRRAAGEGETMGMVRKFDFGKAASVAVCLCALALFFRFFAARLLAALLPFLLAAALAALVRPLARRICRRLPLSEGVCSAVLFFLFVAAALLLGGFAAARLLREAQGLLARLLADAGSPYSLISGAIDALRLPSNAETEAFREQLKTMLNGLARDLLGQLTAQLSRRAARAVTALPSALFFSVVVLLAGARFCLGGGEIGRSLLRRLPERWQTAVRTHRPHLSLLFRRYLRAYALLFALTFSILFFGFLLLGLDYAVLPALLIALVDLLPVLGVGTVLVPWAAAELLCRNYYIGFGLLLLCLAAAVVRQVAEPRLVGRSLGVPALLSLAAGYVGWQLAGALGLLLGPLSLPLIRTFFPGEDPASGGRREKSSKKVAF